VVSNCIEWNVDEWSVEELLDFMKDQVKIEGGDFNETFVKTVIERYEINGWKFLRMRYEYFSEIGIDNLSCRYLDQMRKRLILVTRKLCNFFQKLFAGRFATGYNLVQHVSGRPLKLNNFCHVMQVSAK
jgi:hypothetical protein